MAILALQSDHEELQDERIREYLRASIAHRGQRVTDLERDALVATYQAPNRTLRRQGRGFVAAPSFKTSGPTMIHGFTKRLALRLQRADLVSLDSEICPSTMTLTEEGVALAEQLLASSNRTHD